MFCCVLLLLLADVAHRAGLDPDASLTVERAMGLVGHLEQLSGAVAEPASPWTPHAHAMRAELAAGLRQWAPMLSRLTLAAVALQAT